MSTAVRGVILDMDGTLVDSNEAHVQTWVETLKSFGRNVTHEVVRPLIGQGSDKLLPRLAGITTDSALGKKMVAHRSALFEQQYLSAIQPFPGSKELVKRMRDAGLKVVIASSSRSNHLQHFIETLGIGALLDGSTSANDVEESKPDPDVVAAALDKLGIAPADVVMIGDTPYDIEAAARVGVRTIALRCGGWKQEGLTGAIAVYADPEELLSQFDASPLAGNDAS
jgi:HAD superfamily hydrolase (TIGR01549 family)